MNTQTIYHTAPISNFTVFSNSLICSSLPPVAKTILQYLISKPKDWRLNKKNIGKTLGLSAYAVQKGINILRNLGYLIFERLKTGFGIWKVYDAPQTRVVEPSVEIPTLDIQTVLPNTEVLLKTEHNYTAPIIEERPKQDVVVVFIEEDRPDIPLPDGLRPSEKRAASKLLSGITPAEAATILVVFNAALKSGKVNNKIGYLHKLIAACKDGTLTTPEQPKTLTLDERLQKQKKEREEAVRRSKIDNTSYFEMLRKQFGSKADKIGMSA